MTSNNNQNTGYVYILTNPSFREDWIKIGKSSRPVDVRSKELDNTAVPLPFEIYATMKTSSYNKVESMLHKILEGAHARIRKNREFFNVRPDVALAAFKDIAELLPDARVFVNGKESSLAHPLSPHVSIKTPNLVGDKEGKRNNDLRIQVHAHDELPKGARYSLDGVNYYSMAKFGFVFVKQLITDKPQLTYKQLEDIFPKNILDNFQFCGVVVKESVVEAAAWPFHAKRKRYHAGEVDYLLRSSDGISFYTSTQWERTSFKKLIIIAEGLGYRVYIKTN